MRLELRGITKEYHGVAVLRDVDFDLAPGEIHALLGENGAGKSTLTKIMAGVVTPTQGSMTLDGKPVAFRQPREALDAGIVMVFQETSLVPSLSVAQNLYLGEKRLFTPLRRLYLQAQQLLQTLNFPIDAAVKVGQLGAAQRQMVEIARAVHQKARVIVFDEPTATLTPEEKNQFFALAARLKEAGVSVVFITHALEEALRISDRITVMRDGARVVTDAATSFDRARIVQAMVGRALSDEIYNKVGDLRVSRPRGGKVLSVQNLSMGRMVRNTSFSVYAGQVTGIFGLVGSGRTETAKVIAGVDRRDRFLGGHVFRSDRPVHYASPRDAMRDGIVYITEDRKIEGFFETMSIADNVFMGRVAATFAHPPLVNAEEKRNLAQTWIKALNIRAASSQARIVELSGGNQQKVVISKSLVQEPQIVIIDEPTRGIDVGAIVEIHQLINRLADDGLAVVVISSYLPEILNLSDRILVSRQGRIVEEFSSEEATEQRIMYAAVH
jgi:simple sugar transport system ATP-binding protein